MLPGAAPGPHAQDGQAGAPFGRHQVLAEQREALQQHVLAVRQQFAPVRAMRLCVVRFHQSEIAGAGIGADVEPAAVVIDLVLVAPLARQERDRLRVGIGSLQVAHLGRNGLERTDQDVSPRPAAPDGAGEFRIGFLVHDPVVARVGSDRMPQDLVRPERLRVLTRIEHRVVAGRPGDVGGHVRDDVRQVLAGVQIPEADRVPASANRIHRIRQPSSVRACPVRPDIAETVAGGHRIDVENHLFPPRLGAPVDGAAAMDGVLPAVLEPPVVEVPPLAVRHGHVGLPDAPLDLLEQPLLEARGVRQRFPYPGVLRLEIGAHRGVVPVAQPVVVVEPHVAVLLEALRALRSAWGRHARVRKRLALEV